MQTSSFSQTCLLMLLLAVTLASSAVLPPVAETTTAPIQTTSLQSSIVPQLAGGHCTQHKDCYCSMGMGMCHEGRCYCMWGLRPEQMSVADISGLISDQPDKTPESSQPKTTKAP